MSNSVRILSATDVKQALPMADAIEGMKAAYKQLSVGEANVPLRGRVNTPAGVTLVMPAYLEQSDDLGVKIVSVFPDNPSRGLPTIHAMVLALDPETGQVLAMMEGGSLTAIRTGAGAGAGTDILARPDAKSVAIIGSGVQARTQLEAVCTVRQIEKVWVYSPTKTNAEKFAAEMAGQGPIPQDIVVTDASTDAIKDAHIICAATTSKTPVFDGTQVKLGTHINGVGSFTPEMIELDETTVKQSLIVMDSKEAVLEEAGEIITLLEQGIIDESHLHAELGEIIAGSKSGRVDDQQITFFKSVGVAVQDAISASIALKNAEAHNLGTVVEL